jgi:hypothetical protein
MSNLEAFENDAEALFAREQYKYYEYEKKKQQQREIRESKKEKLKHMKIHYHITDFCRSKEEAEELLRQDAKKEPIVFSGKPFMGSKDHNCCYCGDSNIYTDNEYEECDYPKNCYGWDGTSGYCMCGAYKMNIIVLQDEELFQLGLPSWFACVQGK